MRSTMSQAASSRIVLGTLTLGEGRSASFELRDGRWLADDPGRCLRWHDGPCVSDGRDTLLLVSVDQGAALRLYGLEPLAARKGDCGTGLLIEAGDEASPQARVEWCITSVMD
jgi:hypothetical protein